MEGDVEYLRRRSQQEREAALKATHPLAREAHLELARRFDEFREAVSAQETRRAADKLSA